MSTQNDLTEKHSERVNPIILFSLVFAIVGGLFYLLSRGQAPIAPGSALGSHVPGPAAGLNTRLPSEEQMLQTIAGTIQRIEGNTVVVRTEWPSAQGEIRYIDRSVSISQLTVINVHGWPKDPETFRQETAEFDSQIQVGGTGLTPPFPNETRKGTMADLRLGIHVAIRPVDSSARPLLAKEIDIPLPPLSADAAVGQNF